MFASFDIKFSRLGIENSIYGFENAYSVLEALPGKLDIKRHSPSILYILVI